MVHLDQVASNPNLDSNFVFDVIVSSLPVPPLVRRFTRPHNPPTYLHDYHCNLASAHVLASTSLTQSHESIATKSLGILYPFLPLFHIVNCPLHIESFMLPCLLLKNQIPMLKP